jgi:large repetitive protein
LQHLCQYSKRESARSVTAVGSAFSRTLVAKGGTPPYTWSVLSGSPPPGVSLSATRELSGSATSSGTYEFTAQVTDQSSQTQSATASYTIVVKKR